MEKWDTKPSGCLEFKTEIMKELQYVPKIWLKYVDDVFGLFNTKKVNIHDFIPFLNNRLPSIKLMFEIEKGN